MKVQQGNAALQLFGFIPEPKKRPNPALKSGGLGVSLPVKFGVPDLASKGLLKVVGYLHNRLTICSYQGGSKRVAKRMKTATLHELCKGSSNFNLCPETRRALKIGGRWRYLPLKTTFTPQAKNMLKDAGQLIETEAAGVGFFLTLTIAGGTDDVYEAMGIASGYCVDRLNRWLRYKVDNGFFGYVWELQERGAPHLHYLFRMQAGTNFSRFYKQVRQEWRKILLDVSEESGVDLFEDADGGSHRENINLPVINFRVIKTTMVGYLAKYASKERTKGGANSKFIPGRWWGVSYAIRREVLMRRVSFVFGATCVESQTARLLAMVEKLGELVKSTWRMPKDVPGPGEYVSLGLRGISAVDAANSLRHWLESGSIESCTVKPVVSHMVRAAPA